MSPTDECYIRMSATLNWGLSPLEAADDVKKEPVVYFAEFDEQSDDKIELAVQACIDKAIGFLLENVVDESRYLLFEWDVVSSTLTIVVTDDLRENDSRYVVKCLMSALDRKMNAMTGEDKAVCEKKAIEYASTIKYWVKDYLTTSSEFLKYSLVAVFHSKTRDKVELL